MFRRAAYTLTIVLALPSLQACHWFKTGKDKKDGAPSTITPDFSGEAILDLSIVVDEDAKIFVIKVKDLPKKAKLACKLNKEDLKGCAPDSRHPLPKKKNSYSVAAVAKVDDQVVGVGEARFSIGTPAVSQAIGNTIGTTSRSFASDLTLEVDPEHKVSSRTFENGMPLNRDTETVIKFRFAKQPLCKPTLRCSVERLDSAFNPICDLENGKTFKVKEMAQGLQFLRVTASCGDQVGEPLVLFWYGVPENYEPMALTPSIARTTGFYSFNLVKSNDCPQNLLSYECRNNASEQFRACRNTVERPGANFEIRAVCNGKSYQSYKLSSAS